MAVVMAAVMTAAVMAAVMTVAAMTAMATAMMAVAAMLTATTAYLIFALPLPLLLLQKPHRRNHPPICQEGSSIILSSSY